MTDLQFASFIEMISNKIEAIYDKHNEELETCVGTKKVWISPITLAQPHNETDPSLYENVPVFEDHPSMQKLQDLVHDLNSIVERLENNA